MSLLNSVGNSIIDEHWMIKGITYLQKLDLIREYKELPYFKIIEPTENICLHFLDSIGYSLPSVNIGRVDGKKIETINALPNLYEYNTYDEVLQHLSDRNKKFYFVKLTRTDFGAGYIWGLVVFEQSNISERRDIKIEQILTKIEN